MTDEMNVRLTKPYTAKEVSIGLSQMHPYKSLGPDGTSPIFFQNYWHIVGPILFIVSLIFLITAFFHSLLTTSKLYLCRSVRIQTQWLNFDSLCNVIYKLCSKTLANRLKSLLSNIISAHQSAFVKNRLITDNILVAHELHHIIKSKISGKEGLMSIKLDMSKAFDIIE